MGTTGMAEPEADWTERGLVREVLWPAVAGTGEDRVLFEAQAFRGKVEIVLVAAQLFRGKVEIVLFAA